MKKVFEPVIKSFTDVMRKTMTEDCINNQKAIENLNGKILELVNDKCMVAPYLASSLVNLFKPENKSQFRLIKDLISLR